MMESGFGPYLAMVPSHGATVVTGFMDWWRRIDSSVVWQERIFLGLAIAYAVIAVIALVRFPPHNLILRALILASFGNFGLLGMRMCSYGVDCGAGLGLVGSSGDLLFYLVYVLV